MLILDANEDVKYAELTDTIRLLGLKEAITTRCAARGTVPTYNRESKPIGSIFMSPTFNLGGIYLLEQYHQIIRCNGCT